MLLQVSWSSSKEIPPALRHSSMPPWARTHADPCTWQQKPPIGAAVWVIAATTYPTATIATNATMNMRGRSMRLMGLTLAAGKVSVIGMKRGGNQRVTESHRDSFASVNWSSLLFVQSSAWAGKHLSSFFFAAGWRHITMSGLHRAEQCGPACMPMNHV